MIGTIDNNMKWIGTMVDKLDKCLCVENLYLGLVLKFD